MVINSRQLSLLQVGRRHLGLTEDQWRALLIRLGGSNSAAQLTPEGFEAVLATMERLGFAPFGAVGPYFGDRAGMATPKQVQYVRDMWRRYTGRQFEEAEMNRWLQAKFGVSSLRFADLRTVSRVIAALKDMTARASAG